jgi:hypothetical protein
MGWTSRSSGAESEQVGHAEQSRREAWGATSGRRPHAGRPGASRSKEAMLFIGEKKKHYFFIK